MYKIAFLTLLQLTLICCSGSPKTGGFDYGEVNNGVYSNEYFDFSFRVPSRWIVMDQDMIQSFYHTAADQVFNEGIKDRFIEAMNITTAILFYGGYADVATGYDNSLQIIAENISHAPHIRTGKDYQESANELMRVAGLDTDLLAYGEPVEMAGREFSEMTQRLTPDGLMQKQRVLLTKGFALIFVITYTSEEDLKDIEAALASLRFE